MEELIEDALRVRAASFQRHGVKVIRDYDPVPLITAERHKVMQIIANLAGNAKHAICDHRDTGGTVTLRLRGAGEDRICFEMTDDGIGISEENLSKVFNFGFTTKTNGHGFGLHASALAAKEMGGTLIAESEGEGLGATFILELPISQELPVDEPTVGVGKV